MCRRDPLFWLNAFCWVFEPRSQAKLPLITWPAQDDGVQAIRRSLYYKTDRAVLKSRDQGVSWWSLAEGVHRWQFTTYQAIGVASRTEELVEKEGDPDSLFWKMEFLLEHQPAWLLPRFTKQKKRLVNLDLGSTIKGYATTDDLARGGRLTSLFLDEFAAFTFRQGYEALSSTQYACPTRIAVSTPKGAMGAFFDMVRMAREGNPKVQLYEVHWSTHREQRKGLYRTGPDGKVELLDGFRGTIQFGEISYRFPEEYPFILDGKLRSPYYDGEVLRSPSKQKIASELDMEFAGSGGAFFDEDLLKRAEGFCRAPLRQGRLEYDPDTFEPKRWVDDPRGPVSLWCELIDGRPAKDEYAAGSDIGAGTGATPSTLAIGGMKTGEKVCEYADAYRMPHQFAPDAIALCKWFHDAKLAWETPGPGSTFTRIVIQSGYRSLYYKRTGEDGLAPKPSTIPGWYPSADNKKSLMEDFRDALASGDWVERSEATLRDCRPYIFTETSVEHAGAVTTDDPSGARLNHGDRAVASALCWKLIREAKKLQRQPKGNVLPAQQTAPPGSVAWIMEQEKLLKAERELMGGLRL